MPTTRFLPGDWIWTASVCLAGLTEERWRQNSATSSARCKAGVALDPGGHPDLSQVRFKQPFMILTGPNGVTWGARQLFEQLSQDAWFIKIRDAGHDEFGDMPNSSGAPGRAAPRRSCGLIWFPFSPGICSTKTNMIWSLCRQAVPKSRSS